MTPDVNVLVAAFRCDHPHGKQAHDWLSASRRACADGTTTLVLLLVVVAGFLRLVTNPRVFSEPDSIGDAVQFIDALAATPGVEFESGGPEWPALRAAVLAQRSGGNIVTDVWIAAAVTARSEHLVTFDRDFARLLPARDLTLLATA